jgi:hypothetical protein
MAAAQGIPLLAETLQSEQESGDQHLAQSLRMAEERMLVSPLHNPEGIAHFISSLFIGRSIVDVIGNEKADADWVDATMAALEALLPG